MSSISSFLSLRDRLTGLEKSPKKSHSVLPTKRAKFTFIKKRPQIVNWVRLRKPDAGGQTWLPDNHWWKMPQNPTYWVIFPQIVRLLLLLFFSPWEWSFILAAYYNNADCFSSSASSSAKAIDVMRPCCQDYCSKEYRGCYYTPQEGHYFQLDNLYWVVVLQSALKMQCLLSLLAKAYLQVDRVFAIANEIVPCCIEPATFVALTNIVASSMEIRMVVNGLQNDGVGWGCLVFDWLVEQAGHSFGQNALFGGAWSTTQSSSAVPCCHRWPRLHRTRGITQVCMRVVGVVH